MAPCHRSAKRCGNERGLGKRGNPKRLAVGVQTVEKNQIKRLLFSQGGMKVLVAGDRVVCLVRESPAAGGIETKARINGMFLACLYGKKSAAFGDSYFQITLNPAEVATDRIQSFVAAIWGHGCKAGCDFAG